MTIETATYISSLNASYPAASDPKSEGDDHIRLLKSTVKATFPNVSGAVTPTHTELNFVDGVTSAIQTQLDAKASLTGTETLTNKTVNLTSNTLTGTTAQFNTALSDGDFATLAGTETLTNKTLTAPVLTNPTVTASSGTAMKVTNTGTGDSFVVEDSASTDSTPFVIDAGGIVIVGYTTALNNFASQTSNLNIESTAGRAVVNRWNSDTSGASVTLGKSKVSTIGTQTVVASGDEIGAVNFQASDGTGFIRAAVIQAAVDGTPGLNDMPGRLVFSTTADGASSPTERMRIDSAGNVGIGGTPTYPFDVMAIAANSRIVFGDSGISNVPVIKARTNTDAAYRGLMLDGDSLRLATGGTVRAIIDSTGTVTMQPGTGLSIARTAVTAPAASDGNVFSGTYTPTLTNTTNVASSTAFVCQYMRVGTVVTVSGQVSITPTANTTQTVLGISLPIASNFTSSTTGCSGTGAAISGTTATNAARIISNVASDYAEMAFVSQGTGAFSFAFTFTYQVL